MENKLKWICSLIVVAAIITCWSTCLLGSRILFPEEYKEPVWWCGTINDNFDYRSNLPDSLMKTVEVGKTLFEANCA